MSSKSTAKPAKSFSTLAADLKARRKPTLSREQIERANKIFEEVEKERSTDESKRKIARQPEA